MTKEESLIVKYGSTCRIIFKEQYNKKTFSFPSKVFQIIWRKAKSQLCLIISLDLKDNEIDLYIVCGDGSPFQLWEVTVGTSHRLSLWPFCGLLLNHKGQPTAYVKDFTKLTKQERNKSWLTDDVLVFVLELWLFWGQSAVVWKLQVLRTHSHQGLNIAFMCRWRSHQSLGLRWKTFCLSHQHSQV